MSTHIIPRCASHNYSVHLVNSNSCIFPITLTIQQWLLIVMQFIQPNKPFRSTRKSPLANIIHIYRKPPFYRIHSLSSFLLNGWSSFIFYIPFEVANRQEPSILGIPNSVRKGPQPTTVKRFAATSKGLEFTTKEWTWWGRLMQRKIWRRIVNGLLLQVKSIAQVFWS